jgi:hypothetical protein
VPYFLSFTFEQVFWLTVEGAICGSLPLLPHSQVTGVQNHQERGDFYACRKIGIISLPL